MASSTLEKSVYEFSVKDNKGKDAPLSAYQGKVALIANVAAECGYTDNNMEMYTKLQEKFGADKFVVLAFPSDEFGQQMGDMDACSTKFKASYPTFGEVNGDASSPLFAFLREATQVPKIKWNFEKFLVNQKGEVVKHYSSAPNEKKIVKDVEALLKQ